MYQLSEPSRTHRIIDLVDSISRTHRTCSNYLIRRTHRNRSKRSALVIACLTTLAFPSLPTHAQTESRTLNALRDARRAAFDQRAIQMLADMTEAYASLTSFSQKTEFRLLETPIVPAGFKPPSLQSAPTEGTASSGQNPPDRSTTEHTPVEEDTLPRTPVEKPLLHTVRLMISQPNLLRLEVSDVAEKTGDWISSVAVSDGKTLWTYDPDKKWYSKADAPKSLRGFQKVDLGNSTLELMMILGFAPFTNVTEQFDAIRYEGVQQINGTPTDVVCLKTINDQQTQELRFFIGTENHLLYRLVVEAIPTVKPLSPPPKHDPLDDLIDRPLPPDPSQEIPVAKGFEDPRPIAPPSSPMRVRLTLENTFEIEPVFATNTFQYTPPKDASLYQNVNGGYGLGGLQNQKSISSILNSSIKPTKPRSVKRTRTQR